MKSLTNSLSGVELEVLRSILQEAGISSHICDPTASNRLADTHSGPELWIEHDEDYSDAHAIYTAWCKSLPDRGEPHETTAFWGEMDERAHNMSSVLEAILHQPTNH